jgi:hypothetical protein
MKRQLAALLLGLSALPGIAAEAWRDALPHAQMIGQGDYRWLGMRIYEAQLWTGQPSPSLVSAAPADPARVLDAPVALRLVYARDIGAQRLVDTSIDEIVRMQGHSLSDATLQRWRDALSRVMVDVRAGDRLTGVYLPNKAHVLRQ